MIPIPSLYLTAGAAALAGALAFSGAWSIQNHRADARVAVVQHQLDTEISGHLADRTAWEQSSRASEAAEREKETLRRKARDKEVEDARIESAAADRRVAALRRAGDGLRYQVDALVAATDACSRGGDTTATPGSQAATGPGLVLADLYRRVDDEARELAGAFDAARRAGLACERIFDSLTPSKGASP